MGLAGGEHPRPNTPAETSPVSPREPAAREPCVCRTPDNQEPSVVVFFVFLFCLEGGVRGRQIYRRGRTPPKYGVGEGVAAVVVDKDNVPAAFSDMYLHSAGSLMGFLHFSPVVKRALNL